MSTAHIYTNLVFLLLLLSIFPGEMCFLQIQINSQVYFTLTPRGKLWRMSCQNTLVHRDLVDRFQTILPANEQMPCGVAAPAWPSFPAQFTSREPTC